jgi:transposase
MYAVEVYATVRQLVFAEGLSRREVARRLGLSRDTVRKMCRFSEPPGYRRTKAAERPKLGPLTGVIDAVLAADRSAPAKQRHTAKRIWQRLRDEHGFGGGYSTVKDYVRLARGRAQEAFVPLVHPPGHAQVDFGEAVAAVAGETAKVHFFCLDLPHSDAAFVKAYPAETTEAFLDGHVSAFAFFGGVPQSVLYDNTKLAVARILPDGTRERTRAFTRLISHYAYKDRFGRPGKGNDKGKVEALVKHARRAFLTPVPRVPSLAALNAELERQCLARLGETAGRDPRPVGERLGADLGALMRLPASPFEACDVAAARASSTALVRYRGADYSVPTGHAHQPVVVKGFVEEVVVLAGASVIARHRRAYGKGALVLDPLHYLALIEEKPGALDQAAALQGWELPPAFAEMRRLLEARMGPRGKREYVQVLRLMEIAPMPAVSAAVTEAIRRGVIGFDAVRQLVLARIEGRPPRLDPRAYPYLPTAKVRATAAADYAALLSGRAA